MSNIACYEMVNDYLQKKIQKKHIFFRGKLNHDGLLYFWIKGCEFLIYLNQGCGVDPHWFK